MGQNKLKESWKVLLLGKRNVPGSSLLQGQHVSLSFPLAKVIKETHCVTNSTAPPISLQMNPEEQMLSWKHRATHNSALCMRRIWAGWQATSPTVSKTTKMFRNMIFFMSKSLQRKGIAWNDGSASAVIPPIMVFLEILNWMHFPCRCLWLGAHGHRSSPDWRPVDNALPGRRLKKNSSHPSCSVCLGAHFQLLEWATLHRVQIGFPIHPGVSVHPGQNTSGIEYNTHWIRSTTDLLLLCGLLCGLIR